MVIMQIVRAGKSARELSLRTVTRRLELVASDCIVVEVWPLEGIKVRSCTLCVTPGGSYARPSVAQLATAANVLLPLVPWAACAGTHASAHMLLHAR